MSDREVFLAHVAKLVAWLRTCGLDRVDARSDFSVEDYSRDFVVWLIACFPVWKSPPSNRPDAWIRSLEAAHRGLHEVQSLPHRGMDHVYIPLAAMGTFTPHTMNTKTRHITRIWSCIDKLYCQSQPVPIY